MEKLLDAVAAVVREVSSEKVHAIASRIRRTDAQKAEAALLGVVGTPAASDLIKQLTQAWQATTVNAEGLAMMLLAASHVFAQSQNEQSTELVWTGPTTPFISARRTEQALLEVINAANSTLFITSFVAYDVSSIVKALNGASDRGVVISMLLELSQEHGGNITFDAIGKMRTLIPSAQLYGWHVKTDPFADGSVHAKVAVADGSICFITSANLTGYAMEKNMEMGILIEGGGIPERVRAHLCALVTTGIIKAA